jgi:hypothetical protein
MSTRKFVLKRNRRPQPQFGTVTPIGDESPAGNTRFPVNLDTAAVLSNGNVVVVTDEPDGIFVQVYSSAGEAIGSPILAGTLNSGEGWFGTAQQPQVVPLDGGGFVVTWDQWRTVPYGDYIVFDPDGTQVASGQTDWAAVSAVPLAGGGFVLGSQIWVNTRFGATADHTEMQTYDGNGYPRGPHSTSTKQQSLWQVEPMAATSSRIIEPV